MILRHRTSLIRNLMWLIQRWMVKMLFAVIVVTFSDGVILKMTLYVQAADASWIGADANVRLERIRMSVKKDVDMFDLISRNQAIEAIKNIPDGNWARKVYVNEIKSLPSMEHEIIHCKDCVHHFLYKDKIPCCSIKDYGYGWEDNDYCSRAERIES